MSADPQLQSAYRSLKPGALLAPVPAVMVSCGLNGKNNIITIAWAGTVCSHPPMFGISLRLERYSYSMIRDSGEFVINLTGEDQMRAMDLCGVVSGREKDKFALCGLTPLPADGLAHAPAIAGTPLYLACRVRSVQPLGSHHLFLGEAVSMGVREDLLDADGRVRLEDARLVAYSHGAYYGLGAALGFFGCSVAEPEVLRRRMEQLK